MLTLQEKETWGHCGGSSGSQIREKGAVLTRKQVADHRHGQFLSISEDKDKVKTISFTGSRVENSAPIIFAPADEITSPVF